MSPAPNSQSLKLDTVVLGQVGPLFSEHGSFVNEPQTYAQAAQNIDTWARLQGVTADNWKQNLINPVRLGMWGMRNVTPEFIDDVISQAAEVDTLGGFVTQLALKTSGIGTELHGQNIVGIAIRPPHTQPFGLVADTAHTTYPRPDGSGIVKWGTQFSANVLANDTTAALPTGNYL